jgi:cytochrome P450
MLNGITKVNINFMAPHAIHQDKDVFDLPHEFLQSRWLNPSQEMKGAFVPFLIGNLVQRSY